MNLKKDLLSFCNNLSIDNKTSRSSKSRISNHLERFRYDLLDPETQLPLTLPRGSLKKASEFLTKRRVYQLIQFREAKGASTIRRERAENGGFGTDHDNNFTVSLNKEIQNRKNGVGLNDSASQAFGEMKKNSKSEVKESGGGNIGKGKGVVKTGEDVEEGREDFFKVVIDKFDLMSVEEEDRVRKIEEEKENDHGGKGKGKNKRKK